ncbi:MAG: adenylyltransferase/cytidyltransferase family protein [Nanoarchaeota archaeon]
MPKVLVSGCFDFTHSGHIAFLEQASSYGDLYVALGSDKTIHDLKGRPPVYTQDERLYIIQSIKFVKEAYISPGNGFLDFKPLLQTIKPDILIVNKEGNYPEKKKLCEENKIKYIVLDRMPKSHLPIRSSTSIRGVCTLPFRLDLAGGWLDQPFVSSHCRGSVVVISLEPTIEFNHRSGMASSTRNALREFFCSRLPNMEQEKLAKLAFRLENEPGKKFISGSQDAIGVIYPGLTKIEYNGNYWPIDFKNILDNDILSFIEDSIYLVPLNPRIESFDPLLNTDINKEKVNILSDVTDRCWEAIKEKNIIKFGEYVRKSFKAQIAMFPNMVNKDILELLGQYREKVLGYKLSGAGGGGYLVVINDKYIDNSLRIKIRKE